MAKMIGGKNHLIFDLRRLQRRNLFYKLAAKLSYALLLLLAPIWYLLLRQGANSFALKAGLGATVVIAIAWKLVQMRIVRQLQQLEAEIPALEAGIAGEEETRRLLSRLPAQYSIISDLEVPASGHSAQLDHVVVGPSGIYIVEVKNYKGLVRGDDTSEEITQHWHNRATRHYNPVKQVQTHARRLHEYLAEHGLRLPVQATVYFAHPQAQLEWASSALPLFCRSSNGEHQLLSFLQQSTQSPFSAPEQKRVEKLLATLVMS